MRASFRPIVRFIAFAALAALIVASCASPAPSTSKVGAPAAAAMTAVAAPRENPAPTAPPPALPPAFTSAPPGKNIAVLWTASVEGYVEPCGCTGDPLGGVARLAAAVDDAKRAYGDRVLFLDGGDLLFEHLGDSSPADQCQAAARADLLVSTYGSLGLAATVLGPLDDVRGAEFRDARLAKAGVVTLGATRAPTAGAQSTPSIVRELGGARIGVVALHADTLESAGVAAFNAEVQRLAAAHLDALIVIAQAPRDITKKVIAVLASPAIDVVIQGRAPGEAPVAPERLDREKVGDQRGPILVAAGQQAQYLGALELALDGRAPGQQLALDDRKAQQEARTKVLKLRVHELEQQVAQSEGARKQFLEQRLAAAHAELDNVGVDDGVAPVGPRVKVRAIALPRGFAENASVKTALEQYTKSIPALVASCEATLTCPAPVPGAPTYVGVKTCKTCHEGAFNFWQGQTVTQPGKDKEGRAITRTMGHVHAWSSLTVDGKDKDRDCVGCHSAGFTKPGGPCKTSDIVARGLEAVQCESCHGPGSVHARTGDHLDIKIPNEARCRECHHVPHIPTTESFVMNERLKLILGPGHGEKRRAMIVDAEKQK